MLGINSNINSLVAQQNLTGSGSALSQAITRLSSGKRINSAADDAAGLAISNIMQTQINGLDQGVSNSNDGTSMVQTASSGLSSLTNSLQRIRQLATEAANGSMTDQNRQALQQEVTQQVSEINRIASQTTYNGMNVLNGSLGNVSFQVGANVGQTISLNLSQNMSAAQIGAGKAQAGNTLATFSDVSLSANGVAVVAAPATAAVPAKAAVTAVSGSSVAQSITGATTSTDTSLTVTDNGSGTITASGNNGGVYTYTAGVWSMGGTPLTAATDSGTIAALSAGLANADTAVASGGGGAVQAQAAQAAVAASAAVNPAITSINVVSDGNGGVTLTDQNDQALSATALSALTTANTDLSLNSTTGVLSLAAGVPAGTTLGSALSAAIESVNGDVTGAATQTTAGIQTAAGVAANVTSQADVNADNATGASLDALNNISSVSDIDITSEAGAQAAMLSIDNALTSVDNLQATLGAAQNRFSAIATTQQSQSTDLSTAQSNIQDADFAQETANLSKAQVLQQAGISVLAQANSQPQQILKLLQ